MFNGADSLVESARQWWHAGHAAQAAEMIERALALDAGHAGANALYGQMLMSAGRPAEAEAHLRRAVEREPGAAAHRVALGGLLRGLGRLDEAAESYRAAVRADERSYAAANGLGITLALSLDYAGADDAFSRAVSIAPERPEARGNYSMLLLRMGRASEGLAQARRAVEINPGHAPTLSQYAFLLNYADSVDTREMLDAARRFGAAAEALTGGARYPLANDRDPDRALRIGFLSGDFFTHSVAHFLEPLLGAMDRERYAPVLYHTGEVFDEATERLRGLSAGLHAAGHMDDRSLVQQVAADRIDVLIELSGHTAHNRLTALAYRPAPVIASYLGYPATTGLSAVGWRIGCDLADPAASDGHFTERLIRVGPLMWCWRAPADAPEVVARATDGPVVFGSFNYIGKVSDACVGLWSRVLGEVPGSRLVLKSGGLEQEGVRAGLARRFGSAGVDPARIEMRGQAGAVRDHLAMYGEVDIALDTLPYCGTTTTCEAAWMGVPTVTLDGDRHAARVGAALDRAMGLDELAARDGEAFVRAAVSLARDGARRAALRAGMRERIRGSALMDASGLATRFGDALREMWRETVSG